MFGRLTCNLPANSPLGLYCPGTLLEVVKSKHLAVLSQRVDSRLLLPDPLGGRPERIAQFALEPRSNTTSTTSTTTTDTMHAPFSRRRCCCTIRPAVLLTLLLPRLIFTGLRHSHRRFLQTTGPRIYMWHARMPYVPGDLFWWRSTIVRWFNQSRDDRNGGYGVCHSGDFHRSGDRRCGHIRQKLQLLQPR